MTTGKSVHRPDPDLEAAAQDALEAARAMPPGPERILALKEAGKLLEIPVLDHLIFTDTEYYSFADEGVL